MGENSRGSRTGAPPGRTTVFRRRRIDAERDTNGITPTRSSSTCTKHGVAAFVELDHDSAMPAFEVLLSDKEIVAVFSCIKSRWAREHPAARQDERAGAELKRA